MLLISALCVFPRRWEFPIACALAIPAFLGRWLLPQVGYGTILMIVWLLCWVCFLTLTDMVILRQVLISTRVTNDTISGAICGYLLLGLIFAFVYEIEGLAYPGSFLINGAVSRLELGKIFDQHHIGDLIYYSYVTVASLGYGDLAPVSPPARITAAMEAIAGQFYIAILIARLVSIRYSKWGDE